MYGSWLPMVPGRRLASTGAGRVSARLGLWAAATRRGGGVRGFGELEAAIMNRLWTRQEPATVREILDDLRGDREFAYTTVMTVLDNLHRKGWLTRQLDGRAYRYQPVSTKQEYSAE